MFSSIYVFRQVSAAPLMSFNPQIYVKDMILLPSYLLVAGSNANPDGSVEDFHLVSNINLSNHKKVTSAT